jgi:Ca2+-transporting ATPase
MQIEEVLSQLNTSRRTGLTSHEAQKRLRKYGQNKLEKKKELSPLIIFARQFKSFLIAILIVAAVISAFIQYFIDTAVILSIVILNAVLGFVQEYRAEKALAALEKLVALEARVIRGEHEIKIPATELVPGDIIVLEQGYKVPADARLIEAINLKVNEASLTGESLPVAKHTDLVKENAVVAERKNCIFSSTIITNGRALAVVTSTGMSTEVGKIAELIKEAEERATPLQRKLVGVARTLGIAIILICTIIFGFGVFRGLPAFDMFLTAISLAVAAVPEGLPAVITITLAIGLERMAKYKAIIRKLPAVETLGSCSIICTDKTGTLTKNEITVRQLYTNEQLIDVSGEGYSPRGEFASRGRKITAKKDMHISLLLKIGALCNGASLYEENGQWNITGDPTEAALVVAAAKAGLMKDELKEKYAEISEFSFDAVRKRMSTVHKHEEGIFAFVKGAPDMLLERCSHIFAQGKVRSFTAEDKKKILQANEQMAGKALRVLAMAYKKIPKLEKFAVEDVESDLIFVGLAGMIDPPRPEVKEALAECKSAGIKVCVVTGDHKLTAAAIAQELGLMEPDSRIIDGEELEHMSDEELEEIADKVAIYARVSPEHKVRIVDALQSKGYIVAMTGDGVNDAPALKDADIGIAMGIMGTDVAKEASDMILQDDNFSTIVSAIKQGRGIYDNIKKFLRFLLTSNVGEVAAIFAASLIGLPLPLIAVQILWMNLLTDGLPAIALAVDPIESDIMKRQPRDTKEAAIDKNMISTIILVSIIMSAGTLLIFNFELQKGAELPVARAMAFSTLVIFQMFNVFNSRSQTKSIFKDLLTNKWLIGAVASSILLQVAVVNIPFFNSLFGTASLSAVQWLQIVAVSASVLVIVEIKKLFDNYFLTQSKA